MGYDIGQSVITYMNNSRTLSDLHSILRVRHHRIRVIIAVVRITADVFQTAGLKTRDNVILLPKSRNLQQGLILSAHLLSDAFLHSVSVQLVLQMHIEAFNSECLLLTCLVLEDRAGWIGPGSVQFPRAIGTSDARQEYVSEVLGRFIGRHGRVGVGVDSRMLHCGGESV